ncbi:outer membrane protein, partial [Escherichia coli]|uniref:outer membrane protein n=1 Tax=Escherichia coli TaxID=562 RepID=UPI0019548370
MIGGQLGCDYQFASSAFVIGIEGSASGTTLKANKTVGLPVSIPDTALVQANTDFLSSVTARVGYAFDNILL